MKAILIDSENRTIKEVDHPGGIDSIYKYLNCDCFAVITLSEQEGIYVDDEGLLHDPQHFFKFVNYPQPIAGNGLVVGVDSDGEDVGTKLTVEYFEDKIKFLTILDVATGYYNV